MATVKRMVKMVMAGPAFVVLAGSTAGAALAPSVNQSPIVGAFLGGLIVLVVMAAV